MTELKMPHDYQLEASIIGSFFVDPNCIEDIADILNPQYFYFPENKKLAAKIIELYNKHPTKVNYVEISPFLDKENIKQEHLYKIINSVPSTAGIRFHVERLKSLYLLRAAIRLGYELINSNSLRENEEIRGVLNSSLNKLERLTLESVDSQSVKDISKVLKDYDEKFTHLINSSSGLTGVPSGFRDLDRLTGGFRKDNLIIIGARPSVGKTALIVQIGEVVSIDKGKSTAFFSLEMSDEEILQRMIASRGKIDLQALNKGILTEVQIKNYHKVKKQIEKSKLKIDDTPYISVSEIKAKSKRIKKESGLDLIMIDYLGLIKPSDHRSNRYEQVSQITRDLKAMAKELHVPVIVLSQLSRATESRKDKRPMLSDLRESGEIEQSADIVGLLYRDEYYKQNKNSRSQPSELNIAKQRNGPTGVINLNYYQSITRFFST